MSGGFNPKVSNPSLILPQMTSEVLAAINPNSSWLGRYHPEIFPTFAVMPCVLDVIPSDTVLVALNALNAE